MESNVEPSPTPTLSHLARFRTKKASYDALLKAAKQIVRDRTFNQEFAAADLWGRHAHFGVLNINRQKKNQLVPLHKRPTKKDLFRELAHGDGAIGLHETGILEQIQDFLEYALEKKDLERVDVPNDRSKLATYRFTS